MDYKKIARFRVNKRKDNSPPGEPLQYLRGASDGSSVLYDSTDNELHVDIRNSPCIVVSEVPFSFDVPDITTSHVITNEGTATLTAYNGYISSSIGTICGVSVDGILVWPCGEINRRYICSIRQDLWPDTEVDDTNETVETLRAGRIDTYHRHMFNGFVRWEEDDGDSYFEISTDDDGNVVTPTFTTTGYTAVGQYKPIKEGSGGRNGIIHSGTGVTTLRQQSGNTSFLSHSQYWYDEDATTRKEVGTDDCGIWENGAFATWVNKESCTNVMAGMSSGLVYASDTEYTPYEYIKLINILPNTEGSGCLVPVTVEEGTGIGPWQSWEDDGDGHVVLVSSSSTNYLYDTSYLSKSTYLSEDIT